LERRQSVTLIPTWIERRLWRADDGRGERGGGGGGWSDMRWRINWGGVMESGLKFRVIWTGGNGYIYGGGRWLGGAVRVVEPSS
jgi:hypothetical protein